MKAADFPPCNDNDNDIGSPLRTSLSLSRSDPVSSCSLPRTEVLRVTHDTYHCHITDQSQLERSKIKRSMPKLELWMPEGQEINIYIEKLKLGSDGTFEALLTTDATTSALRQNGDLAIPNACTTFSRLN
jgi:hypothetical protein